MLFVSRQALATALNTGPVIVARTKVLAIPAIVGAITVKTLIAER
jgi:hypothetical protein